MVDSSLPPVDRKQQRLSELLKMKANCKSDDLEKLKTKCEILVRDCIAGLLVELSNDDFKNMEGELEPNSTGAKLSKFAWNFRGNESSRLLVLDV